MGTLDGLNFDDPYGYVGDAFDGFQFIDSTSAYNGFSEEQPKPLTSVSRDGAGNLNVAFAAGAMVNYVVGTNLTLTGMTPSDLNGTFPVTSITFNQQTVNITGGTCQAYAVIDPENCTFTTSTAPAFTMGAFGKLTGVTTADGHTLNGTYEVNTVTTGGFTIFAAQVSRPNWPNSLTATNINSGGTFGTATSLVAAASGSSESASVVGTALHVIPAHRGIDQNAGAYGNGDCVGTGTYDFGIFIATGSRFIDCTQDGWDMLHSSMAQSIYTFNLSSGNMGAPAKFGNADIGLYQNNLSIGNAQSMMAPNPDFPPDYNQYLSLFYRAGDTLPVTGRLWSHMNISSNTLDTGFATIIDSECDDNVGCNVQPSISSFTIQNNIFLGFLDDNYPGGQDGNYPGVICNYICNGTAPEDPLWVYTNNIGYNIHAAPSTGTGNNWAIDPKVVTMIPDITTFDGEANALIFDMHLQATSPAIGAGAENAFTPTLDFSGSTRPNPPSIGAYELGGAPPSTVNMVTSGTILFSGSVKF